MIIFFTSHICFCEIGYLPSLLMNSIPVAYRNASGTVIMLRRVENEKKKFPIFLKVYSILPNLYMHLKLNSHKGICFKKQLV